MARSIIGVIVAYVAMFILNILAFVGLYVVVGPDHAFKPHRYLASNRWIAITFALLLVTGVLAGLICAAIARGGRAPLALAVVIIVVGLLLAIPSVMKARANSEMIRMGHDSWKEAMNKAYWPVWAPFMLPFPSAIGVVIGGRLKKRS
jgi:hypothetical protein